MKAKVTRWVCPTEHPMLDISIQWILNRVPGDVYERMCLRHGKEHWLCHPSHHGKMCPSSGWYAGIECRCDECHAYQECWPDWRELSELPDEERAKVMPCIGPAADEPEK